LQKFAILFCREWKGGALQAAEKLIGAAVLNPRRDTWAQEIGNIVPVPDSLLASRMVRVVAQTTDSFRTGFELYRARLDKGYSLTDCISMQTMRREGIAEVLTNDVHFEQEGFRAVLRESRRAG
jgi:predicted nucleic-acid-binding protein